MLKLALGAVVAIPAMMFTAVLGTGVMIVDVQAEDGRIIVPVPMLAAQLAAAVIPEHHIPPIEIPEEFAPAAREMVAALLDAPDGELVRVEDDGDLVIVTKVGDVLEVIVMEGDGEEVRVNLPLDDALDLLIDAEDGLTPSEVVSAVRGMRFTQLVDVRDGDERVKVSIW